MDRAKGIAFCGLACCVCSENAACAGCRNDGCKDREWCAILRCCREKKIKGCYACADFPCDEKMLQKTRVRAFCRFMQRYGEDALLRALERNEKAGVVYHMKGCLTGDYDAPDTEEGVLAMLGAPSD